MRHTTSGMRLQKRITYFNEWKRNGIINQHKQRLAIITKRSLFIYFYFAVAGTDHSANVLIITDNCLHNLDGQTETREYSLCE